MQLISTILFWADKALCKVSYFSVLKICLKIFCFSVNDEKELKALEEKKEKLESQKTSLDKSIENYNSYTHCFKFLRILFNL